MMAVLVALMSVIVQCDRWQIKELKPSQSYILPFGQKKSQIQVHQSDQGIFHTPADIAVDPKDLFVVNDYASKVLRISRDNGKITAIYHAVAEGKEPEGTEQKEQKGKASASQEAPEKSSQKKEQKDLTPQQVNPRLEDLLPELEDKKEAKTLVRNLCRPRDDLTEHSIPLSRPGKIAVTSSGKIILQNRPPIKSPQRPRKKKLQEYIPPTAPSHLVIFQKDGKLLKRLYRLAEPQTPFRQIIGIHDRGQESFSVISRESPKKWFINIYSEKDYKTLFDYEITPQWLKKNDQMAEQGSYKKVIETIIPESDNRHFLISVAYYKNARFKMRRILRLNKSRPESLRLYTEFVEPQNELFATLKERQSYIWTMGDDNQVTLKIFDKNGDIRRKKGFSIRGKSEAWRDFIPLYDKQVVTIYISRVAMELIFWH
jgi:hypothetical protein